eukprot:6388936-Amphidinium_carterae.1
MAVNPNSECCTEVVVRRNGQSLCQPGDVAGKASELLTLVKARAAQDPQTCAKPQSKSCGPLVTVLQLETLGFKRSGEEIEKYFQSCTTNIMTIRS